MSLQPLIQRLSASAIWLAVFLVPARRLANSGSAEPGGPTDQQPSRVVSLNAFVQEADDRELW